MICRICAAGSRIDARAEAIGQTENPEGLAHVGGHLTFPQSARLQLSGLLNANEIDCVLARMEGGADELVAAIYSHEVGVKHALLSATLYGLLAGLQAAGIPEGGPDER